LRLSRKSSACRCLRVVRETMITLRHGKFVQFIVHKQAASLAPPGLAVCLEHLKLKIVSLTYTAIHKIHECRCCSLANIQENKKSQSNLGRAVSPPLTQRMDLAAACAVRCPLQTSPITELRVRYSHTAVPHFSSRCCRHAARPGRLRRTRLCHAFSSLTVS